MKHVLEVMLDLLYAKKLLPSDIPEIILEYLFDQGYVVKRGKYIKLSNQGVGVINRTRY